jgi:CheY-like chemotaxis protein
LKQPAIQTIILADDDEDDRYIFRDIIKEIAPATKIFTVPNGLWLMEMLGNFAPDVLFLDLDMPYKNGLECLIEIRNSPELKNLFIIIFSSSTRQGNIQTAYEIGADLFLIKEASFKEYKDALKAILELNWKEPGTVKQAHFINDKYVSFVR